MSEPIDAGEQAEALDLRPIKSHWRFLRWLIYIVLIGQAAFIASSAHAYFFIANAYRKDV